MTLTDATIKELRERTRRKRNWNFSRDEAVAILDMVEEWGREIDELNLTISTLRGELNILRECETHRKELILASGNGGGK